MKKEVAGKVAQTMDCPKCKGVAHLAVPAKIAEQAYPVYGCPACGHAFKENGTAFVDDMSTLKDYFHGATLGNKALTEGLGDMKLPPAAMVLLQTQIIEYGTSMWFDGLKQGLLLGAINAHKGQNK